MKIKYVFWILFSAMVAVLPLAAQADTAIFAPFISRFDAEVRNNLVRLSWVDSGDVRGPVYIYRSTVPFEMENRPVGSRPLVIPYGVQSHVDEVETTGTFYYFAVASDETGRSYDIPIAFLNTIAVEIMVGGSVHGAFTTAGSGWSFGPGGLPQAFAPSGESQTGITSMEAGVQGDKVIITFSGGNARNANLYLYRSTRPISQRGGSPGGDNHPDEGFLTLYGYSCSGYFLLLRGSRGR